MDLFKSIAKAISVYMILLVYTMFLAIYGVITYVCSTLLLLVIFPILGVIESFGSDEDAWETAQSCITQLNEGAFNG